MSGMPQYGLDSEYPELYKVARAYDFAERLGGCTDPLMAEIDRALHELWSARRARAEERGSKREETETSVP